MYVFYHIIRQFDMLYWTAAYFKGSQLEVYFPSKFHISQTEWNI